MSLKKSRVIACIGTIILAFIFHFAYEMLPNFLFSIFFPVNESVWEHMKMIYSAIVFYGIIDYFLNKKYMFYLFLMKNSIQLSSLNLYMLLLMLYHLK